MCRPSVVVTILIALLGAACATQPKQSLETTVPQGMTATDVELAVLLATGLIPPESTGYKNWDEYVKGCLRNAGRLVISGPDLQEEDHWIFEMADRSSVRASYTDGAESLEAKIDYSATKVSVSMLSSRNLDESGDHIDPRANDWLADLRLRINRGLGRVQFLKHHFSN